MIRKIISIICMLLVISTSFVSAQSTGSGIPIFSSGIEETGESIIVNVDRIEPTIVPTNILEEQPVPVYVYLKGATLGSLALGEDSPEISPLFGIPEIERVSITSRKSTNNMVSQTVYIKPRDRRYVVDESGRFFDMGYLILQLRKTNERELEGFNDTLFSLESGGVELSAGGGAVINAEIGMDIRFDLESNFGGFGAQDLRLIEEPNEDEWRDSIEKASFWARNGYVRADRITDDSATLSVYDGRLRRLRTFTLNKGEEGAPTRLRDFGPAERSFFRVRLNDVTLPRNTAKLEINGDVYELVEGQRLYPGSDWKVERIINDELAKDRKTRYDEVIIVNSEGQRKSLRIVYVLTEEAAALEDKVDRNSPGFDKFENKLNEEFISKVEQISRELKINPNHLMAVMAFESGFDPIADSNKEASGGCIGLIQFCPDTGMKVVGTTEAALKSMSAVDQLDLVKKYLERYKDRIRKNNLADVYMAVLWPDAIRREQATIIFSKPSIEYEGNIVLDLDEDEKVTIKEAVQRVIETYPLAVEGAAIAEIKDEEVCEGVEFNDEDALEQTSTRLYCKSISEINEAINKGLIGGELSNAHYYLGQAYEKLGENNLFYKREAVSAYGSVSEGLFLEKALERKEELEKEIGEKADKRRAEIYLEKENVDVILKDVKGVRLQEQPTVRLSINNEEKTLKIGDRVINGADELNREFNWVVDSITSRRITLKQVFTDPLIRGRTETINLDEVETLQTGKDETAVVQILSVDTKKQAYITVLPGSGRGVSRSTVDVEIPIERRSIQFNTEQIDKQIDATRKVVEKLDDIIDKLDKIIKTWRAICLGTFAFLTLKNLGKSQALEAKSLILRGVDGKSGFGQYCRENSGAGKQYTNYDECVIANQDYIERRAREEEGNIKGADGYIETSYETNYKDYRYSDKDDILVSAKDVRELELLELQIEDSDKNLREIDSSSVEYNMESDYNKKLKELYEVKKSNVDKTKEDIEEAKSFSEKLSGEEIDDRLRREAFEVRLNELSQGLDRVTVTIEELDAAPITFVEGNAVDPNTGKIIKIEEVRGRDYINVIEERINEGEDPVKKKKLQDLMNKIKKEPNKIVITEDGKTIYKGDGKYYYSTTENYYGERIRRTYARPGYAEYYENGRPFCVPTSNGNYVRVLEYFEDGTPKTVDERNVGPNGILCDSDDVIINSDSIVKLNPREEQELKQAVTRAGFCRSGDYKTANFICSHARSKALNAVNELHCTDVMGIGDCKILFNVCDPVMCPTSRFNFGGKWYVDNVPETGIIGSLVLGMPNSNFAGGSNVIPPVCLPGVQAGLEGIRSVFQGYEQCLQTSKTTGENVGICDKVKSVFICENIWREAVSLTGTTGALNVIKGKFFGEVNGGGEYAPNQFNKKLDQVGDSAKFFINEYSTASLSAYEARSLGQAGTEICKNIYAGKAPGIGKLIDQVLAPESPPQFTAFFDEYPWSSSAGDTRLNVVEGIISNVQEQSRYSVFYHIYAGRATDIRYSVYLKDNLGNVAYVTERAGGRARGFVPAGDFVSKNIDFVGRSGYSEICVEINGREDCGFGRASTSIGIDYITDRQVESELNKKIETKEQCVPEDVRGPLIGGPTSFGDVEGGLLRVCSIGNPGEGGLEGRWEVVGKCGEDEEGIDLGSCWIDTTTIRLNNEQNVDENVKNIIQKYDEEKDGLVTDLSKVDFGMLFINKDNLFREYLPPATLNIMDDWKEIRENIIGYEDDGGGLRYISVKSVDYGAKAQLDIGRIYLLLADEKLTGERVEREKEDVPKSEEEADEDNGVTGLFDLCVENDVYYCVSNNEEGCAVYGGIAEKAELTQEQCKNERKLGLTDANSCDGFTTLFGEAIFDNRNTCHKRTKDVNACFWDSETTCRSCDLPPVQRAQCSVYKDEVECEKWDPCVFNCAWLDNRCISVKSYEETKELNELQITTNAFVLNYVESTFFSDAKLKIDLPDLRGEYYIENDKSGSTYPIYRKDDFFDDEIGYVREDRGVYVTIGIGSDKFALESLNIKIDVLDRLFNEKRGGFISLSDGSEIPFDIFSGDVQETPTGEDSAPLSVLEGDRNVDTDDLFILRFKNGILYVQHAELNGVYYIKNEKKSGTYSIYNRRTLREDGLNFIDKEVGYVGLDGNFNIVEDEENRKLLGRMNVDNEKIASLFSNGRDGIYELKESDADSTNSETVDDGLIPPESKNSQPFDITYELVDSSMGIGEYFIKSSSLTGKYYISKVMVAGVYPIYKKQEQEGIDNQIGYIEPDGDGGFNIFQSENSEDSKILSEMVVNIVELRKFLSTINPTPGQTMQGGTNDEITSPPDVSVAFSS